MNNLASVSVINLAAFFVESPAAFTYVTPEFPLLSRTISYCPVLSLYLYPGIPSVINITLVFFASASEILAYANLNPATIFVPSPLSGIVASFIVRYASSADFV